MKTPGPSVRSHRYPHQHAVERNQTKLTTSICYFLKPQIGPRIVSRHDISAQFCLHLLFCSSQPLSSSCCRLQLLAKMCYTRGEVAWLPIARVQSVKQLSNRLLYNTIGWWQNIGAGLPLLYIYNLLIWVILAYKSKVQLKMLDWSMWG